MEPRACYCRDDRPPPEGLPPGFCGWCCLCGAPGHTRHHPGSLPYTGSWCDLHFEQMRAIYFAAFSTLQLLPDKSLGLPKLNCRYFCVPGMFTYRRFFRHHLMDAYLEFRSDVLARYALVDPRARAGERHQRWDHPISMWLHPYPLEKDDGWLEITAAEFDALWQRSAFRKGSRQQAGQDDA